MADRMDSSAAMTDPHTILANLHELRPGSSTQEPLTPNNCIRIKFNSRSALEIMKTDLETCCLWLKNSTAPDSSQLNGWHGTRDVQIFIITATGFN